MFTHLLDFAKTSTESAEKKSLSIILVNMTLAGKRELNKMVTSGLISVLCHELDKSSAVVEIANINNFISALSNIASTNIDFRDMIIAREQLIFHKLNRLKHRALQTN